MRSIEAVEARRGHSLTDSLKSHPQTAATDAPTGAKGLGKPTTPRTLSQQLQYVANKVLKYLGRVIPHKSNSIPPSLSTLRTKAYILSLPTSQQLRLVTSVDNKDETLQMIYTLMDEHQKITAEHSELENKINFLGKQIEEINSNTRITGYQKRTDTDKRRKIIDDTNSKLNLKEQEIESNLKRLDAALATAINKNGTGFSGVLQALRNGLRDTETLRGLRTDWRYWEMLGVSPVEYEDVAANPDSVMEWLDLGFSAKEALSFKKAGFNPEDVTYLKGTGVTGPIAKQMHLFGYSKDFFPQEKDKQGNQVSIAKFGFTLGNHHDAWTENSATAIGSGAFNTPMAGYFMNIDSSGTNSAATNLRVFKKEKYAVERNSEDPASGTQLALNPGQKYATLGANGLNPLSNAAMLSNDAEYAPRIGLRNVMASNLAEAMGLTVIVKTEFSARTTPLTEAERAAASKPKMTIHETLEFGISMHGVKGVFGYVNGKRVLPKDTEKLQTLIEESIDLQLFDAFIGQIDRNDGNIMIDEDGHVFGIDNDQCFPDDDDHGGNINRLVLDHNGSRSQPQRGVLLPEVITEDQQKRWLGYDEKFLREKMPFATEAQKKAAMERLKKIKEHIQNLPPERIVKKAELTTEQAKKWLLEKKEFQTHDSRTGLGDTSYYGRLQE